MGLGRVIITGVVAALTWLATSATSRYRDVPSPSESTAPDAIPVQRGLSQQVHVTMYQQLISVRNTELQVFWVRYNILAILNTGLLFGALSRPQEWLAIVPWWVLPSFGFAFSVLWLLRLPLDAAMGIGPAAFRTSTASVPAVLSGLPKATTVNGHDVVSSAAHSTRIHGRLGGVRRAGLLLGPACAGSVADAFYGSSFVDWMAQYGRQQLTRIGRSEWGRPQ